MSPKDSNDQEANKHVGRLYQYWFEHYKDEYSCIWQVIPPTKEQLKDKKWLLVENCICIKLLNWFSVPDEEHTECKVGGVLVFPKYALRNNPDTWTPISKDDVGLIILREMDRFST